MNQIRIKKTVPGLDNIQTSQIQLPAAFFVNFANKSSTGAAGVSASAFLEWGSMSFSLFSSLLFDSSLATSSFLSSSFLSSVMFEAAPLDPETNPDEEMGTGF